VLLKTDSDWAGDKNSRQSVSGFLIFVCDVVICTRSRSQQTVSLTSSEAEFYVLSEAVNEIHLLFDFYYSSASRSSFLLKWVVHMSEIPAISARTRQMDNRFIKVEFVRSETKTLDIITKNVSVELFKVNVEQLNPHWQGNNPWSMGIQREPRLNMETQYENKLREPRLNMKILSVPKLNLEVLRLADCQHNYSK